MKDNNNIIDSMIRLAMRNQSIIEGKGVSKGDIKAIAMHDLIVKQEKIINKYYAKLCK
ncbi:hypothetical protein KD050_05020 [Psychrobacillus sp. INOP01]|uniref:hypothetical protein n=1 Tax=Psychrobacillus sp. INOP01 TaxID=2829187 RepID=UPI001BAB55A2|nr:hypothetical protein [Psychrobacillus sp. INOP01]QUG42638.1 hypothetical protein KD050_05020 [Psychrobacillus sp. INOP01]